MKKLLLLGGSAQQVVAIETAKKLGYYTVLCDYLLNNPGQYHADKFYRESTTDKEAILKIAEIEKIDGIIAYASDPAAPTAAYVAEKLSLPDGCPYDSVEILCNKDRFRRFLKENGFSAPYAEGFSDFDDAINAIDKFALPVIVKPVDSSGSKGATVVYDKRGIENAVNFAFSFSRSNRIIIEEFIEKKHEYLIGGDIFVLNGRVVLWGLLNCHRDPLVNKLVPVGKSYPLRLSGNDIQLVKDTLQTLIDKLSIKNAAMNVELIIDKNNKVWPVDIGPRNGGNMIPDLLGMIFDVNVVEMALKIAVGERIDIKELEGKPFYATHNLHSNKNGILKRIEFSNELEPHIIRKSIYKNAGDVVEYFDNASKALGIIFMKFDSKEQMFEILSKINSHIKIHLSGE